MLRGRGPPQHLNSDIVIKFWPPETREGVCQELGGHQERVHAGDHHYCHQHQAGFIIILFIVIILTILKDLSVLHRLMG